MKVQIIAVFVLLAVANAKPNTRAEREVSLRLFTRQNPTEDNILSIGNLAALLQTNFNLLNPVKFFAHGPNSPWENPELVEAFLAKGDYNVILIDWTAISNSTDEDYLIRNAKTTGGYVAGFIDWISTLGVQFSNIHVIGFSIGCHAAGYTARYCNNGVVEYVTGLDPPISNYVLGNGHLNANDAKYVEIVHTGYEGGMIFRDPIGDADFYPNGGATQPGCSDGLCNHMRAVELFIESIGNDGFVAKKCTSIDEIEAGNCADLGRATMGGTTGAKDNSGVYYLTTNSESPFAQGDY